MRKEAVARARGWRTMLTTSDKPGRYLAGSISTVVSLHRISVLVSVFIVQISCFSETV